MSEQKPLRSDEELARALDQLFEETPPPETSEEIDETLRWAGYDPEEVASRMQAAADRAWTNSPLNWRNRGQELEEAKRRLEKSTATSAHDLTDVIERIKQILTQQPQLAAHFRNIESIEQASREELVSLLEDLSYLMDQQEQDDEGRE